MDKFQIKERIRELVGIIYEDYSDVGGALHIVLDDYNIEDDHIKWCLDKSIKEIVDEEEKAIYKECAELLLQLSYSSRKRLIRDI